ARARSAGACPVADLPVSTPAMMAASQASNRPFMFDLRSAATILRDVGRPRFSSSDEVLMKFELSSIMLVLVVHASFWSRRDMADRRSPPSAQGEQSSQTESVRRSRPAVGDRPEAGNMRLVGFHD